MKRMVPSVAFFLVAVTSFFLGVKYFSADPQKQIIDAGASLGEKDDPDARARYEWMMLRDPKTNEIPRNIREKELAFAASLPTTEALANMGRLSKKQTSTWVSRGPVNQGGRTRALAIDVSDETHILAGGISGGMWRSTDSGTSWTRTTTLSLKVQSVTCVAQDTRATKQNIWYYGTGERAGNSARGGGGADYLGDGIYKSTDGGITWALLSSTASNTPQSWDGDFDYVWNIVTDSSNASQDEVYAAVYGGIKRSTNGGSTWSNALTADASLLTGNFTDVAITSGGVLYATISSDGSTNKGIFRSPDGITWTGITPALWPTTYGRVVIGMAPSNQNVIYFLAETAGGGLNNHSLWKYTDNGSGTGTWENRSANLPAAGLPVGDFDSQGGYDLIVKVKPNDTNAVFIGGTNLYRSTDGFATTGNTAWIGGYATTNDVSQYANHHPDQHSMAFLPSNTAVLLSGHDGGISKTSNDLATSVTWSEINTGYVTSQFYSVAVDHGTSGNGVIIGGLQDNGHLWSNGSSSWVTLPHGGDGCITAIANGRLFYYIATQNGSTIRLVVNAAGSAPAGTGIKPTGATGQLFVTPYVLDPNNTNIMYYSAGDTLWRNSNLSTIPNGPTFGSTSVNWANMTNTGGSGSNVSAVVASKSPANRVYFGTQNGKVYRVDGANSGNPTPTEVTGAGFSAGPPNVSCIAVNPRNADTAVVVFSNYLVKSLFLTTNGGTSWTDISGNLEQNADGSGNGPSTRWAAILPTSSGAVFYVATSTGLYSTSTLSGTSTMWAQEGASTIGNVVVSMIVARQVDGFLVAATHANGIFTSNALTSVNGALAAQPTQFTLEPNYPNPFNPTTRIRYSLAERGKVRLSIYNESGKQVAVLVDQEHAAGTYERNWDARNTDGTPVSSGVYFARLEQGRLAKTQKLVFIK